MTDFLDGANTRNDRRMIGMESGTADAFDKWDRLSKTDTQDGLDKIGKYVELVERERRGGTM